MDRVHPEAPEAPHLRGIGEDVRAAIAGTRGARVPGPALRPALLVVDMQRYFLEAGAPAHLPAGEATIATVNGLIRAFDEAGLPVFATRYASTGPSDPIVRWWGTELPEDDAFSDLDPRLQAASATVLVKHQYGTLSSTPLHQLLTEAGVDTLMAGVMTELCCETTAREAFHRGYAVWFVADACATARRTLHVAAIATLARGFTHVVGADWVSRNLAIPGDLHG